MKKQSGIQGVSPEVAPHACVDLLVAFTVVLHKVHPAGTVQCVRGLLHL